MLQNATQKKYFEISKYSIGSECSGFSVRAYTSTDPNNISGQDHYNRISGVDIFSNQVCRDSVGSKNFGKKKAAINRVDLIYKKLMFSSKEKYKNLNTQGPKKE